MQAAVAWWTCTVGADVATMIHTAIQSSTNALVKVQLLERLAIAAVAGFMKNIGK